MSRRKLSSSAGGVNLAIIVTPMLDMSFQLLSFFIMVYSPHTGEEFIGADLTKTKSVDTSKKTDIGGPPKGKDISFPIGDIDPKLQQTLTIVLTLQDPAETGGAGVETKKSDEGVEPRFIIVRSPATVLDKAAKDPGNVFNIALLKSEGKDAFDELQISLEKIYKALHEGKKKEEEAKGPDEKKEKDGAIITKFRIEADQEIQFSYLIRAYAACKNAGFEDVIFTSPLD